MRLSVCLFVSVGWMFYACDNADNSAADVPISSDLSADTLSLIKQGDSLFLLGRYYDSLSLRDSAILFHESALRLRSATKNKIKLLESYESLAHLFHREFKYEVADPYYDKARMISDSVNVEHERLVELLCRAADCKSNLKDIASAQSLAQRALLIVQSNLGDKPLSFHRVFKTMGIAYYYGENFDKAREYWLKSESYLSPDDYLLRGSLYNNLGTMSHMNNKDHMALPYFDSAIANIRRARGENAERLARIYLQKSYVHTDRGEYDLGKYYLVENLRIRKEHYSEKSSYTYGAKVSLGQFFADRQQYDSALYYFQSALISLVDNFNVVNPRFNPSPSETDLNTDLVIGLVAKASTLGQIANNDSLRLDDLKQSLNTYLLADSVLRVYLNNFSFDDAQLRQLDAQYIPYGKMLSIAFTLFDRTTDNQYLQTAFDIIEGSRARLLSSSLNQAERYGNLGLSDDFKMKERSLRAHRSEIIRMLNQEDIADKAMDSLQEIVLKISDDVLRLRREIGETNSTYSLIREGQKLSLGEIQSFLTERNSVFLEYLWGENEISLLAIYPDHVRKFVIDNTSTLRQSLDQFAVELTGDPGETYKLDNFQRFCRSAHNLYELLIRDALPPRTNARRPSLIISADGRLASFPFEALIVKLPTGSEVDYRLAYLLNDFEFSYAQSASILIHQGKSKRDGAELLALGFAGNGETTSMRSDYTDLPGTEREILSIKEVMKNHVNKYYVHTEASESNFKRSVSDFDIAHLAIHGVADSLNALESRLIFRTNADTIDDGNLYAHELYELDLKDLDLAVLSACESGIGKQQSGEGVMSIARGFAYAGCPSQIISLWKIDDRTTAEVMRNFYKHLSKGEVLNDALGKAKREYISTAKEFNSHPFYWAAFLQVGDTRPISVEDTRWILTIAGACIVFAVILGAVYFVRRRKARSSDHL